MSASVTTARRTPVRAGLSGFFGTALEYYDFNLYGIAAAYIFPAVFFSGVDGPAAVVLSLLTFAVSYVVRPVGAIILGQVGDRVGRKTILVFTLMLMGISTVAIGLLPSSGTDGMIGGYGNVGVIAPLLLIVLRICQGLSASVELSGSTSLAMEHAPTGRRGRFTALAPMGSQAGQVLATLAFIPILTLPHDALITWGWRIPFLLSAIVIITTLIIRSGLHDAPSFLETKHAQTETKRSLPLIEVIRTNWASLIRVLLGITVVSVSSLVQVFSLSFAASLPLVENGEVVMSDGAPVAAISATSMLWMVVFGNVLMVIFSALWGALADRVGRKPIFVFGALSSGILSYVFFWIITTGDTTLTVISGALLLGVFYSAAYSIWPVFFSEQFATRVRMTGLAVSTQLGLVLVGFAPAIAAGVQGDVAGNWIPVGTLALVICVIAAIAGAFSRETRGADVEELGR